MKLINGDYTPDGTGGFVTCIDAEERLSRILFKLNCRRGGFAMRPQLGSRLYLLLSEKREQRNTAARKYILEALESESGLTLYDVSVTDTENGLMVKAGFKLNGEGAALTVHLA